jgi:hypothetical protein
MFVHNFILCFNFTESSKPHSTTHSLTVDISAALQFHEFTVHFSGFFPTYLPFSF